MIVDSKEIKQKKTVQQLCILEIRQEETKVQASRKEIVLYVETLGISPSNVVKEVQLTAQSRARILSRQSRQLP
jgi:hypothetical protein